MEYQGRNSSTSTKSVSPALRSLFADSTDAIQVRLFDLRQLGASTFTDKYWRKGVGVEPTGDGIARRPPVVKSGRPQISLSGLSNLACAKAASDGGRCSQSAVFVLRFVLTNQHETMRREEHTQGIAPSSIR